MKHLSLAVLSAAFVFFSLSSCGKKSDAPGADSTKAATEAAKPAATGQAANLNAGKYPVKSGVIHSETEAMGMKTTRTKYFDDYGGKLCEESSSTINMGSTSVKNNKVEIIKDGWMYSLDLEKKTGTKMKFSFPATMDFKNMGEKMMKDMGIKEAGTETILGKECKIYEYTGGDKGGMTGKTWIFWNVEAMKMDMKMGNMAMKSHVTSIEENVSVPSGKFDVPADITIKEVSMPASMGGK